MSVAISLSSQFKRIGKIHRNAHADFAANLDKPVSNTRSRRCADIHGEGSCNDWVCAVGTGQAFSPIDPETSLRINKDLDTYRDNPPVQFPCCTANDAYGSEQTYATKRLFVLIEVNGPFD